MIKNLFIIVALMVTLAANSTINADASTTLTMSGVIGGTGFGITKKGTRCKKKTMNANGRCALHQ